MQLHHVEYGRRHGGTPIVFLGSIASHTDMWLNQLDVLSHEHHVIALDHRGHGLSQDPEVEPFTTGIDDLVDDILTTLDELGVEDFRVVGLSLGGVLAQYLAATSERVESAAFLCTAAYFGGEDKWRPRSELTRAEDMDPMLDGVLGLWVTDGFQANYPATTDFYRRMILSTRGVGYASCADALAQWDFRERLGEITCPVLTLAGEQDASTPPSALETIAAGVGGEVTSVVVSPGAHVPTIEAAEQVNDALVEFFSRY
ncbi:alpha/beta hydrolase [Corynebacterium yudongzhengii]|uniref:Alpha/beta hydrolase n=1 Tax=Corynebacterium yudongzhengii TaxID=2080740 RepID=A0A2U1T9B3_9CORY|nr:alpha/beta fold hydrolase [Corynebacterium yudongzhengii]AWB82476.1 alpha/beta hydrolase [Corynebacterium yudongzhengii]PWC02468.1 alpha/beta hydrolase [Corynebacterium yudongzhengii]